MMSSVCTHRENISHEHFYFSESLPSTSFFNKQHIKDIEEYLDELTINIR